MRPKLRSITSSTIDRQSVESNHDMLPGPDFRAWPETALIKSARYPSCPENVANPQQPGQGSAQFTECEKNRTLPAPPAIQAPLWLAKPSASGPESALWLPAWVTTGPFA